MGVKLMVEVLDHYHGPHARKLWLIAWAEKVTDDGSRTGYCKREVLAARLGRSQSRVSGIARELENEGTIKRLGGGVWGKTTVYELLPLEAAQGQPRAHPTQGQPRAHPTAEPGPHAQGQPRAHAQGQPRAHPNPDNPDKPSSSSPRTPRTGSRGLAAATADDEDHPLKHTARDPRAILDGLPGVDGRLREFIIARFEDEEGIRGEALADRLLQLVGEGTAPSLVSWARRALAEQDPAYARTQGPRRAPPCPDCGTPYSPAQLSDDEFYRKAMAGTAGCVHEEPR